MTWLHVRGHPAAQGSKRHVGGGRLIESSKRLPKWREAVQDAALQHLHPIPPGVPVRVEIHFVMPRPKSLPKSRPTPPAVKRIGDLDKLCRAILDGLDGPAYADDSQVVELVADKRIAELGEEPGARIHVSPVEALKPPTPTRQAGEGQTRARGPK